METPTGYGRDRSAPRLWPKPPVWVGEQEWTSTGFRRDRLESPTHAFFDLESEESAAQPNWHQHRGQPYYRLRSYELKCAPGSVGRELALHAVTMAFQSVLVGSSIVDVAYGPEDAIRPVVLSLGPPRTVTVLVRICLPEGEELAVKHCERLSLPGGRFRTELAASPAPGRSLLDPLRSPHL
jgi:hypothetical protein